MGASNYFKSGDYNAVCDICGGEFKASQLRKTWDGYYACQKDWYPRQPLDFAVSIKDDQAPPFTRPYSQDLNTSGTELTLTGFVQVSSGVGYSPEISNILSSSTVTLTMYQADGPVGTYTHTIQPGVGFTVQSSNPLDLSTLQYSVTI